jgi:hypothetical protein
MLVDGAAASTRFYWLPGDGSSLRLADGLLKASAFPRRRGLICNSVSCETASLLVLVHGVDVRAPAAHCGGASLRVCDGFLSEVSLGVDGSGGDSTYDGEPLRRPAEAEERILFQSVAL